MNKLFYANDNILTTYDDFMTTYDDYVFAGDCLKKAKKMTDVERIEMLEDMGYEVDGFKSIKVADDEDSFLSEGKYLFNRFLDARWMMAQMIRILQEEKPYAQVVADKGIGYMYKFLVEETHRLSRMEHREDVRFETRSKFFSLDSLSQIFKEEVQSYSDAERIANKKYSLLKKKYRDKCNEPIRNELFLKCYMGLGAYYTSVNLIKYHNCTISSDYDGKQCNINESLKLLHARLNNYGDTADYYYIFFEFMKELLRSNGWNEKYSLNI